MSEMHHSVEEQRVETDFGLRVTEFLRAYGKKAAILAGIAIGLVLVVLLWRMHRREVEAAGFTAIANAADAESLAAVASQYRGTPAAAVASFLEANALLDERRYEDAAAALEALIAAQGQDHPIAPHSTFLLAMAREGQGNLEGAIEAYGTVAAEDGHPRAPEALSARARCLEQTGRSDPARQSLEDLLARYPESVWASEARGNLARLRLAEDPEAAPDDPDPAADEATPAPDTPPPAAPETDPGGE